MKVGRGERRRRIIKRESISWSHRHSYVDISSVRYAAVTMVSQHSQAKYQF